MVFELKYLNGEPTWVWVGEVAEAAYCRDTGEWLGLVYWGWCEYTDNWNCPEDEIEWYMVYGGYHCYMPDMWGVHWGVGTVCVVCPD